MKPRSCRLTVEALEDRSVPSLLAQGDFNNDGLSDVAEVTSPNAITVRLANPDGSYIVSDVLRVPKSQPLYSLLLNDSNGDGNLDIVAFHDKGTFSWLGNGDGTFDLKNCSGCGNPGYRIVTL